jgi:ubiquinone biosynthesis protein
MTSGTMRTSVATDLGRLNEIALAVARHGFGHLLARSRALREAAQHGQDPPDPAVMQRSAADRLASLLEDLGPTFVKLGQLLSTRADLLPPAFIEALSRLQDQVPPLPFDVIKEEVERGLGRPVTEVFAVLEPVALASASIAQVHGATLRTGEDVVVKVQRPGIRGRMEADISLMGALAGVFDAVIEEAGIYRSRVVVEEFQAALQAELDFTAELRNIQAFHAVSTRPRTVRIPRVHPLVSSSTVLCMERFRGHKLTDLPAHVDREEVARRLLQSSFEQVFEDGLFHADPHPGNVLVLENGDIALLDFGLVGRLSRDGQSRLVSLMLALALRDSESLARVMYRMGDSDERVSLGAFKSSISELLARYEGRSIHELESQALMRELLDLAVRHHVRVPREYALLGKATITFEGVLRDLCPTLDVSSLVTTYATRMARERFQLAHVEAAAPRLLLQMLSFAQDIPLQASQILLDLEAGKLTVRVAGPGIWELARAVRLLGLSVVGGGVAAGLVVASMLELGRLDWRAWGVPVLPLLGLLSAGAVLALVVGYVVQDGKMPKASLRTVWRWLGGGP